jgi:ABC-2 type transport system permease protein
MIRTTLAAVPRRIVMLTAKAIVVTTLALAVGTIAVLGSLLAGRLILPGQGYTRRTATPTCRSSTRRCSAPPPGPCSILP